MRRNKRATRGTTAAAAQEDEGGGIGGSIYFLGAISSCEAKRRVTQAEPSKREAEPRGGKTAPPRAKRCLFVSPVRSHGAHIRGGPARRAFCIPSPPNLVPPNKRGSYLWQDW